ncbi:hypothetical protein [Rhodoferax sp.]|uniref:hypothetical protein n=1 Tax=Rhodoferax sp. TaxID=50421 RepID=UPI00275CD1C0|nr:hypothetical protein [Rhodoferax sp.]
MIHNKGNGWPRIEQMGSAILGYGKNSRIPESDLARFDSLGPRFRRGGGQQRFTRPMRSTVDQLGSRSDDELARELRTF